MNTDRRVQDLSAAQGGAIRLDQVLGSGMTRSQVKQRLRTGRWSKLVRGSYLVRGMTTVEDYLRAAAATLPGAVISHESAAERHGLSYVTRGLATVLVHSQTTHDFPGVIVRRCHDLHEDHVSELGGLPTTTIPRTIVDLAAILTKRNVAALLDDAVTAKTTSVEDVAAVAAAVRRPGKPGTQNLRSVLEMRMGPAYRGTPLERKGNGLLLTIDEHTPMFEFPIPWRPDNRYDAAYPSRQLAIEWDSRRWHTQAAAFDRDRARDREAVLHGWRLFRFTWEDVTLRPTDVIAAVRRALNQKP